MKLIKQSYEILAMPQLPLELIELAGRTCYKSEDKITPDSAAKFVDKLLKSGHHSVIEHPVASVKFITDRGVTHELVRHRLASYSQESTRYCNYASDHITYIVPVWIEAIFTDEEIIEAIPESYSKSSTALWLRSMLYAEQYYKALIQNGWRPEQARAVLPNSLKTEIVMTANLREWRHVFKLRCSKAAHPQIRELMLDCLEGFQKEIPVLFDDLP